MWYRKNRRRRALIKLHGASSTHASVGLAVLISSRIHIISVYYINHVSPNLYGVRIIYRAYHRCTRIKLTIILYYIIYGAGCSCGIVMFAGPRNGRVRLAPRLKEKKVKNEKWKIHKLHDSTYRHAHVGAWNPVPLAKIRKQNIWFFYFVKSMAQFYKIRTIALYLYMIYNKIIQVKKNVHVYVYLVQDKAKNIKTF